MESDYPPYTSIDTDEDLEHGALGCSKASSSLNLPPGQLRTEPNTLTGWLRRCKATAALGWEVLGRPACKAGHLTCYMIAFFLFLCTTPTGSSLIVLSWTSTLIWHSMGGTERVFYALLVAFCILRVLAAICQWDSSRPFHMTTFTFRSWISSLGKRHDFEHMRTVFRDTPLPPVHAPANHTHGIEAGKRTAARAHMLQVTAQAGLNPYVNQTSSKDDRENITGERVAFWLKDEAQASRADMIPSNPCFIWADVEHYVDMNSHLARQAAPHLMFTTQPTVVANSVGEATWTFANNKINVQVSGGANYNHPLWDYTPDVVCAVGWFLWLPVSVAAYKVEKYHLEGNLKAVVLLTPFRSWGWRSAWLAYWLHRPQTLKHLSTQVKGKTTEWSHLAISTKGGREHSIGHAGHFTSQKYTDYEVSMGVLHHLNQAKGTVSSMSSWMDKVTGAGDKRSEARDKGLVLISYLGDTNHKTSPVTVTAVKAPGVQTYTANINNNGDHQEKPTLYSLMYPVIDGAALAPSNDPKTGEWAARKRVTDLQQGKGSKQRTSRIVTPRTFLWMKEFTKSLVGVTGCVSACGPDEVMERRSKPRQQAILQVVASMGRSIGERFKAFVKREAYDWAKTPRVISTIPGQENLAWSRYSQPMNDTAKRLVWYAFRTPMEIANRMVDICGGPVACMDTSDVTRMDGNTYAAARILDCLIISAITGEESAAACATYLETFSRKTKIDGFSYNAGLSTRSGEGATSFFNTMRNAFMAYATLRMLGWCHQKSWDWLLDHAVLGGDDAAMGVPCGIDREVWTKTRKQAASLLDYTLKVELVECYQPFRMLARYWNSWAGDNNSCTDIVRALSKFHTTTSNLVTQTARDVRLGEKVNAILTNDAETPLIGPLAKSLSKAGFGKGGDVGEDAWWAKQDSRFPNTHAQWMDEVVGATMPDFDHAAFEEGLSDPTHMPVCLTVEQTKTPDFDVIIDDVLTEGTEGQIELMEIKPKKKKEEPLLDMQDVRKALEENERLIKNGSTMTNKQRRQAKKKNKIEPKDKPATKPRNGTTARSIVDPQNAKQDSTNVDTARKSRKPREKPKRGSSTKPLPKRGGRSKSGRLGGPGNETDSLNGL